MKQHKAANQKSGFLHAAHQWFLKTPDRSLELAYKAALNIHEIEKKHFNGRRIASVNCSYGESVFSFYQSELTRNLSIIKTRLTEFRNSRSFIEIYNQSQFRTAASRNLSSNGSTSDRNGKAISGLDEEQQSLILDKLTFIDEVTAKYRNEGVPTAASRSSTLRPSAASNNTSVSPGLLSESQKNYAIEPKNRPRTLATDPAADSAAISETPLTNLPGAEKNKEGGSLAGQTSFLPRSILRTLDRLKRELDPKAEEDVVQEFRSSKTKTIVSLKFILLLILIPLLTQQVSKNFIVGPIYNRIVGQNAQIFLNVDMKEEALMELSQFHEMLEFENLLITQLEKVEAEEKESLQFVGKIPRHLSEKEVEEEVKHKALELAEEYTYRSADAIKNIFSDIFSFFAFGIVVYNSRREIENLKSFMDDIVYGLSDSAKAFIIILFTDIFVGFHSPHGWEVILEGISRHLGLPESREFIYLFIATFPVILDTVFKYWIFRYLNRISPSAVATYRNMNE